jgi:SAM-dependent methyltransferase
MKLRPGLPDPADLSLNEIFRQSRFLQAAPAERRSISLASSQWRSDDEALKPFFELYFPNYDYLRHLTDKVVLDFGCFTGGRGVRWAKQYQIKKLLGTDINEVYLEAAREYASSMNIDADFRLLDVSAGALIPFADASIDTIVSFDVFEHVDDLARTLRECARVLVPGGVLFAVFPSFYNPLESHLGLITRVPALQWLFSPSALTDAYCEILEERGEAANWYKRSGGAPWEKLPTLNGTTPRSFTALIRKLPFDCIWETRKPVLVTGRRYSGIRRFFVKPILDLLLASRVFDAVLLDRIAVVLRKNTAPTLDDPHR